MSEKIRETIIKYLNNTVYHPTAKEIYDGIRNDINIDNKAFLAELEKLEKEKRIAYILVLALGKNGKKERQLYLILLS